MRTQAQTENISRLASFLESLPINYPHFDMEDWFHPADHVRFSSEADEIEASEELIEPRMGSCGCALGHSRAAGVTVKADSWLELAREAYGIEDDEFDMVFAGELCFENNTPAAAARRLRALLPVMDFA